MSMSRVQRVDKGGKAKEVDEKTDRKYSLKRLALSLVDETEVELRNMDEGRNLVLKGT